MAAPGLVFWVLDRRLAPHDSRYSLTRRVGGFLRKPSIPRSRIDVWVRASGAVALKAWGARGKSLVDLYAALRDAGVDRRYKIRLYHDEAGVNEVTTLRTMPAGTYAKLWLDIEGNHVALTPKAREKRDDVLDTVARGGGILKYILTGHPEDIGMVLAAVTQSGSKMQYASKTLKKNREVVLSA